MANTKKKRVAVGISDWPEELGKRIDICEGRVGETDQELIARAQTYYAPKTWQKIEVEERS